MNIKQVSTLLNNSGDAMTCKIYSEKGSRTPSNKKNLVATRVLINESEHPINNTGDGCLFSFVFSSFNFLEIIVLLHDFLLSFFYFFKMYFERWWYLKKKKEGKNISKDKIIVSLSFF